MNFWTPASLRTATGGTWLHRPDRNPREDAGIIGLSTDTRTLAPGRGYLAIRGERFDGHDFLLDACEAGAPLLVIEDGAAAADAVERFPETWILRVADTRKALTKMAAAYRRTLETTRVIAITGSNGKTTTGRLIDAVLRTRFRGTVSARSFNNDIGVPLTILSARPGDQYLICEVGTNSPGEIEALARIVEPDIAIITLIGRAHIEHFGSTDAIAREKASLLSYIRPGGTAIITAESGILREFIKPIPNVLTFGRAADADLRLTAFEHVQGEGQQCRFTINDRRSFTLALYGEHNAMNALAAVAVGHRFGLDDEEIARGLRSVTATDMRMQRETISGVDVFNDAYNASPESTVAAVRTFAALTGDARRRVIVIGDMLELGDAAPGAHREVAEAILEVGGVDAVVTVGAAALYTADELSQHWPQERISMFQRLRDDEARRIAGMFSDGDAVLIKGSRGMRLEQVIAALRERVPSGPGV